jgi:formiminotetrahydrofolate cyclodeaminase
VAFAAALAGMVARASGAEMADADAVARRMDELRARLGALAGEDAAAYGEVLRARDPRARAEALSRAAEVPLEVAETGAEIAELTARLASEGRRTLRGDAVTGSLLAEAGARAAAELVATNLEGVLPADDRADRARVAASRAEAARRAVL